MSAVFAEDQRHVIDSFSHYGFASPFWCGLVPRAFMNAAGHKVESRCRICVSAAAARSPQNITMLVEKVPLDMGYRPSKQR